MPFRKLFPQKKEIVDTNGTVVGPVGVAMGGSVGVAVGGLAPGLVAGLTSEERSQSAYR